MTHKPDTDPADPTTETPEPPEEAGEGAATPEAARKERVLHTRIPAVLERELKRFAENLRVPVSNLVRTILEEAVDAADKATGRVEAELQAAARVASDGRETLRTKLRPRTILDEVFAFQPIVMAQDTRCTACGTTLGPGSRGFLGLRETPGPRIVACAKCVPSTAPPAGETEPSKE